MRVDRLAAAARARGIPMSNQERLERNKRNVKAFHDLMFNVGDVHTQHNPMVADGKEAFIAYFTRGNAGRATAIGPGSTSFDSTRPERSSSTGTFFKSCPTSRPTKTRCFEPAEPTSFLQTGETMPRRTAYCVSSAVVRRPSCSISR